MLEFNANKVEELIASGTATPEDAEDGFEEAFTFVEEYTETVSSG